MYASMLRHAPALCCFPIESKSRELDSRVYLGLRFVREGCPVLVGSKGGVHKHMHALGPRPLYFAKGLNHQSVSMLQEIHSRGGAVVNLDEENYSAVGHDTMDYMVQGRNTEALLRYIELTFTWSRVVRRKILQYAPEWYDPHDVVVTGNARFDLRRPAFKALYCTGLPERLGVQPGYVLINTAFGAGNHVLGVEHFLKKARFNYRQLYHEPYFLAKHAYQKRLLQAFIHAARRLAQDLPETHVVIRPHPSESPEPYAPLHGNPENLHVVRRGLAQEWIAQAAVLIHHDCTTGLEALFHELPTITYCPELQMDQVKDSCVLSAHMVRSEDELAATVQRVLDGERLTPDAQRLGHLRESVDNLDYSAGERIVDTVMQRLDTLFARARDAWERSPRIDAPVPNPDQDETEEVRKRYEQYRRNKFAGLSLQEVQDLVNGLGAADPDLPRVRVADLGNEGFLLTADAATEKRP